MSKVFLAIPNTVDSGPGLLSRLKRPTTIRVRLSTELTPTGSPRVAARSRSVRRETSRDRLLTNRQQDVLATALEAGYYATPREKRHQQMSSTDSTSRR
ncbi:helix-turn-helix domain-containing protein [Natrinema gelatinilyticum]|uniref:helix-turn-helix domain-containing protein n=1 Tax=Natrinema gelatinilyticum TaxID=2961571 RepID=UPI0030F43E2E